MVRQNWTNLNGEWDFCFDDEGIGEKNGWPLGFNADRKILVPFTYETKLSGIGDETVHEHVWYQRTIKVSRREDRDYILHLEGSDHLTKVWVNGAFAGLHKGAYERASYDITTLLKDGDNLIVIGVTDSLSTRQPRGKQRWIHNNFGCWYVQTTGIWKTVWMEEVPKIRIERLKMTPDLRKGTIDIEADIHGVPCSVEGQNEAEYFLEVDITFKESPIRSFTASVKSDHVSVSADVRDHGETEWGLHTWSPQDPALYDIVLKITGKDGCLDETGSYFGMRDVRIEDGKVLLNGHPIYQKLILDQGYWGDSHLTPPGEEALIEDIDKIHELGFNGLRKHMKIEDERFLYWCDVKGMLVWSEMAACYSFDDEAVSIFTDEWKDVVRQNYNHPCIITWTPFNESWGVPDIAGNRMQQHFTEAIYYLTKSMDSMRPVIVNDGWEHTISDILTLHEYEEKGEVFTERYTSKKDEILGGTFAHNLDKKALAGGYSYKGQPVILSEYGGIAFTTTSGEQWGYGNTVSTEDEFVERYRKITEAIMDMPYMCGFCYTQVSDVQQEVNGLMTIDRKFKVDPARIREINMRRTSLHE